jgi:Carboxypeptidase regulatory-like domain
MPRGVARSRLFLAGCVLLASLSAYGQTLGSIAGEVHDASGAIVPGAAISATNTGTNATRTSVTNGAGEYALPSLPPGIYSVKAEKSGFKTTVQPQGLECRYQNDSLDRNCQRCQEELSTLLKPELLTLPRRLNPHRPSPAIRMIQFTRKEPCLPTSRWILRINALN